jgi:hypothetical protein
MPLSPSGPGGPNDVSAKVDATLHVMHKYNNVAQLGHFRGVQYEFKIHLTIL